MFIHIDLVQVFDFFRHRNFLFLFQSLLFVALDRLGLWVYCYGWLGVDLQFQSFVFLDEEIALMLQTHDFEFQFVDLVVVFGDVHGRGLLVGFEFFCEVLVLPG